jgi:protein involved in polysaccharide export with SLBB domain
MHILPLMKVKKVLFARLHLLLFAAFLSIGLAGCSTTNYSAAMKPPGPETNPGEQNVPRLHIGDTVTITFSGIEDVPAQEKPIKEDGTITLPDVGRVQAAGKTAGELEDFIHELYVPAIYKHLNVTVKTTSDRVYFVRGEIRSPGRLIYVGQITVTKAITSAGDFTDFANHKKVILTRANGQRYTLNADKILNGEAPDPPVYPGDQIEVKKRLW